MIDLFLFLIILINSFLILKIFFNKPILFIFSFLPLFQVILTYARFKILNQDYIDPTINFPITVESAYENSLYLSILILLILIPFLVIIKKFKIYILDFSFEEILGLSKKYYSITIFFAASYPLWVFTQQYLLGSLLDNFFALIIRLFGSAWFFVPILPLKYRLIIFSIFISSLPFAFSVGNRTCFIYPLTLFISHYFFKSIANFSNIFKNFKSLFNFFYSTFLISSVVSVIFISSIFIRLNRNIKGFDLSAIYSKILDMEIGNNLLIIGFARTFDRLIQWQIFSSFMVDKIFFLKFFQEFSLIFSTQRQDWDYLLNNQVGLGLVKYMGIDTYATYSWPVTVLAEGAVRFGHVGSIIYYLLFLSILIFTILIAKRFYINPFFITLNIFSATLINFNGDSISQYIKTSATQFIMFSLFFYVLHKILFDRLEINK